MSVAVAQYAALSRRSLLDTIRQPRTIIPPLLFPLMFMALSSAAFDRTTQLPGFPASDSFLQFLICTTIVQGALFGSISAGSDMAHDIEDGFFDRLIASPVSRTSILVGRVMGSTVFGFLQAWIYFGVAHLFGLQVEGGFPAMLALSLVAALFSAGVGSLASSFAIRTGSSEAVLGAFPLLFSLMFISGAFFPRALMDGWFKTAATFNPLTHMIEAMRYQVITGFDVPELATAFTFAGGFFVVGVALASLALESATGGELMSSTAVTWSIAQRSILLISRMPSAFVPSLIMPVFLTISFAGAFSGIVELPGFPADKAIDWFIPMTTLQGAAFAGITTGMGVARNFETGFYDRFLSSPASRTSLLTGSLLAGVLRGLLPVALLSFVALVAGANFHAGPMAVVMLSLACVGVSLAAGAWAIGLALRFKNTQITPFMQMGMFLTVFLSTAQMPMQLLTGWLHDVARFNPMTNVLALARQGFLGDVTWAVTAPGLLALGGMCAVLVVFSLRGMQRVVP